LSDYFYAISRLPLAGLSERSPRCKRQPSFISGSAVALRPLRSIFAIPKNRTEEKQVKNFADSDYALNKYSEGIVYRFVDGTKFTCTLSAYLAENPGKTEDDFQALKKLSDSVYLDQVTDENAQTKKNIPLNELSVSMRYTPSPEDLHIGVIEAREESERHVRRTELSRRALALLTEKQHRRYLLHHVDGKTLRCIADIEGVGFTKIQKSIEAAEQKIRKFLGQLENGGYKTGF
jgi:hypothetical protein